MENTVKEVRIAIEKKVKRNTQLLTNLFVVQQEGEERKEGLPIVVQPSVQVVR